MGRTYHIFRGSCHYRKVPYTRPYDITYLRTGNLRNFASTIRVNSLAALSLRPECQFEIPCFTFGFYGRWRKEKVCLFIACPGSSTDTVLCFLCLDVFLTYFLFIYSFSLSFITIFLKNCLTSSRLPAYLFFMRKLDQEEHCSYWSGRPGKGGDFAVRTQTFVKHCKVSLLLDLPEFSWLSALLLHFLLCYMSSLFRFGLLPLHKVKFNLQNA
jgi:hypothetical protein